MSTTRLVYRVFALLLGFAGSACGDAGGASADVGFAAVDASRDADDLDRVVDTAATDARTDADADAGTDAVGPERDGEPVDTDHDEALRVPQDDQTPSASLLEGGLPSLAGDGLAVAEDRVARDPAPLRVGRVYEPTLAAHSPEHLVPWDWGYGAAAFDADLDGDLDLLLGTIPGDDQLPCVYENVSEAGVHRFERQASWCFERFRNIVGGLPLTTPEGRPALLAYANDGGVLLEFLPDQTVEATNVPALDGCSVGGLAEVDLDHDRTLEVVVACHIDMSAQNESQLDFANGRVLRWSEGRLTRLSSGVARPFLEKENALAVAVFDGDDDGLLDVLHVVDNRSVPPAINPLLDPGGLRYACAPESACSGAELYRLGEGFDAYGSFMGVALFGDASGDGRLFISDAGPDQVLSWSGREMAVIDVPAVQATDYVAGQAFFSWAAIAFDWNEDGLEDVFVGGGYLGSQGAPKRVPHADYVYLQTPDGDLVPESVHLGFAPHARGPGTGPYHRESRGAILEDFDMDGHPDLLLLGGGGPPHLYEREAVSGDETARRCTIRPVPSVTAHVSTGYAWRQHGAPWRRNRIQGQLFATHSAHLYPVAGQGEVRFPSGRRVPFVCEPGEVLDLREEPWIEVEIGARNVTVQLATDVGPSSIVDVAFALGSTVRAVAPAVRQDDGGFAADVDVGFDRVMVRIDGRWVPRWWQRP